MYKNVTVRYNEADEKNYYIAQPLSKLHLIAATEVPFFTPAPAGVSSHEYFAEST